MSQSEIGQSEEIREDYSNKHEEGYVRTGLMEVWSRSASSPRKDFYIRIGHLPEGWTMVHMEAQAKFLRWALNFTLKAIRNEETKND